MYLINTATTLDQTAPL